MPLDAPLRTVIAFLNTLDVEDDTDVMANLRQWQGWVDQHLGPDGSTQTEEHRDAAFALRTHLRSVAAGERPADSQAIPVTVDLDPVAGVRLRGDTVAGHLAAAVARLSLEQRWSRVKICPADDCRVAFYDESKNHSRQWCSMRVCGNRAKARAHRERSTG